MFKILWKVLLIAPVVLGVSVLLSTGALATKTSTATKVTKTLEATDAPVADAILEKPVVADIKR